MKIGIDIVSIKRIENIFNKFGNKFLSKIFTKNEIREIEKIKNKRRKIEKIAGKFAAKEAVIKALPYSSYLKNIEVLTNKKGIPYVSKINVNISISHEYDYAVAVALII